MQKCYWAYSEIQGREGKTNKPWINKLNTHFNKDTKCYNNCMTRLTEASYMLNNSVNVKTVETYKWKHC